MVVLTKADLEDDPVGVAAELADVGGEVPILTVSARTGLGARAQFATLLGAGRTGVLLGPSGVGKSTLVNALIGDDSLLATGALGADGAGRHTTTRRELVLLPGGGVLIDNPGMREVHLWIGEGSLADAFDDIGELAASCRFSDCRHETEPGCAVLAAVADGRLPKKRLESYHALEREVAELAERLQRRERSRHRPETGRAVAPDLPATRGLGAFGENLDACPWSRSAPSSRSSTPISALGRARHSPIPLRSYGRRDRCLPPPPPSRTGRIPSGRA